MVIASRSRLDLEAKIVENVWDYGARGPGLIPGGHIFFSVNFFLLLHFKLPVKTDPSEIERAYNIRKQQTRFY